MYVSKRLDGSLSCSLSLNRTALHGKLSEALDKVVSLQTGREQVYSKLGEWFK